MKNVWLNILFVDYHKHFYDYEIWTRIHPNKVDMRIFNILVIGVYIDLFPAILEWLALQYSTLLVRSSPFGKVISAFVLNLKTKPHFITVFAPEWNKWKRDDMELANNIRQQTKITLRPQQNSHSLIFGEISKAVKLSMIMIITNSSKSWRVLPVYRSGH